MSHWFRNITLTATLQLLSMGHWGRTDIRPNPNPNPNPPVTVPSALLSTACTPSTPINRKQPAAHYVLISNVILPTHNSEPKFQSKLTLTQTLSLDTTPLDKSHYEEWLLPLLEDASEDTVLVDVKSELELHVNPLTTAVLQI